MTTGRAGGLHKPSVSFADSANFAAGKFVGGLPPFLSHKGASAAAGTAQSESFLEPPALLVVFVLSYCGI